MSEHIYPDKLVDNLLLRAGYLSDAKELLKEYLQVHEGLCRYDHNNFCQNHYSSFPCIVHRTRDLLIKIGTTYA